MELNKIYCADCLTFLKDMPDNFIDCCVTSPPYYGLRDYGTAKWEGGDKNCDHSYQKGGRNPETSSKQLTNTGTTISQYEKVCKKCGAIRIDRQIGLEETPELYVEKLVEIFREVKRVLKDDGTLWLNLGDSYWGGGWRGSELNENSGNIQKGHKGTHCGATMPNLKGNNGIYKSKDLIGIPWMAAFALRADGWYLRQDIIWHKPNPMPESVTDRCTKSHEYIFLLSKSQQYFYDHEAIYEIANYDGRKDIIMKESEKYANGYFPTNVKTQSIAVKGHERWKRKTKDTFGNRNGKLSGVHSGNEWEPRRKNDGTDYGGNGTGFQDHSGYSNLDNPYIRNKRDVWTVTTKPFTEAHFATFPEDLIVPMIKAGCPEGGVVLDPFMGAGTTGLVTYKLDRQYIGIELNADYVRIAEKRILPYKMQLKLF